MSAFRRFIKSSIKTEETTIIADSCRLEGKIELRGTLTIYGSLKGDIKCRTLEICKDAKVNASVEAEHAVVAGTLEGELVCTGHLAITSTGTLTGKIVYGSISVESGGQLECYVSELKTSDKKLLPLNQKRERS